MTLTKKLSITFIITLALASFLMIATPTQAGFFDWLRDKNVPQDAAVMRATTTTSVVAPVVTTPTPTAVAPVQVQTTPTVKPTVTTQTSVVTAPVSTALRSGSKGALVSELQTKLKAFGYYDGKIDGSFGPALHAAVIKFQAAAGLKTDGVVGSGTKTRLNDWGTTWGDQGYAKSGGTTTSPSMPAGGGITIQPVLSPIVVNNGQCSEDEINVAIDGNTPEGIQPINQFNVLRFTIMNESNCDIRLEDIDVAYMTTDMKPYFDEIQVRDVNTNAFLGENDELQEDPNFYLGEQIEIEVHNAAPLNGALLIPAGTDKELMLKLQNFQQPAFDNTVPYQEYLHKYLMFGFHDGEDFDFKWVDTNSPFTVQLENNTWGKRVRIPVSSLSI